MGDDMQVLARLLIAATFSLLAACKSDAEKAETSALYSSALHEQATQRDTSCPGVTFHLRVFAHTRYAR
jgi:hypothetical protein